MEYIKNDLIQFFNDNLIFSKTDLNGVITEVSKDFEEISGYSASELIGKKHNVLKSPYIDPLIYKDLWETITNDNSWSGIIENRRKEGSSYFVKVFITPDYVDNKKIGYLSFRKNIIEKGLYQKTFLKTEFLNTNNIISENMKLKTDITILTDGKNIKNINPEGLKLLGFNNFLSFLSIYNCVCDLFYIPKDLIQNTLISEENFIKSTNNDWINQISENKMICIKIEEELFFFTIEIEFETFGHYLITFYNITEHFNRTISLTNDLNKTTELLKKQEKMAVMGDMLHNIAHQWRQPLGVISSLTSSIDFDIENDMLEIEELKENIDLIQEQAVYLTKTIDTFRNYLKDNNNLEEIDLLETIESTISLVKHTYTINNIDINFSIDNKIVEYHIFGIRDQLTQVFINLFNNSKDAFLEKDDNQNRKVNITIELFENNFIINFIDNAGGIPSYIIDNIFEPYVSTKGKNGTGIGLNMSFDIITKSFLGTIEVHNNKNNGATFTIKIPKN